MKIDWIRKLTSRKLWMSIATFVSMMVVAFGGSAESGERIAALIMGGAAMIGYVVGEGLIDAASVAEEKTEEQ